MKRVKQIIEEGIIFEPYCDGLIAVGIDTKSWKPSTVLEFPNYVEGKKVIALGKEINVPEMVNFIFLSSHMENVSPTALIFSKAEEIILGYTISNLDFLYMCESVKIVSIASSNKHYVSYEGNIYTRDERTLVWASNGEIIDEVKYIRPKAFCNQTIAAVKLPNTIKRLESNTFYRCSISQLIIPSSVDILEPEAINECRVERLIFKDGNNKISFRYKSISATKIIKLEATSRVFFEGEMFFLSTLEKLHIHGCFFDENALDIEKLNIQEIYVNKDNVIHWDTTAKLSPDLILGRKFEKEMRRHSKVVNIYLHNGKWIENVYW